MLRPSSSHHYACYCALLCLLYYHQQQALAVTVVIDGAKTNEWATNDEYQRLADSSREQLAGTGGIDSSGSGSSANPATGDKHQHLQQHPKHQQLPLHHQRQHSAITSTNTKQNAEQSLEQMLRSFNGGSGAGGDYSDASDFQLIPASRQARDQASDEGVRIVTGSAAIRLLRELKDAETGSGAGGQLRLTLPSSSSLITASRSSISAEADDGSNRNRNSSSNNSRSLNSINNNQDTSFINSPLTPASSLNDRGELELALDQLDLIERERKLQLKHLKQLESLERTAETGLVAALSHARQSVAGDDDGARIISDLVSPADTDLEFSWKTHGKGVGAFRREAADSTSERERFCGERFYQAAMLVCDGMFANPYDPTISQPKVTNRKRSVGHLATDNGSDDDELLLAGPRVGPYMVSMPRDGDGSSGSMKPMVARRRKLRTLQATDIYEGDGEPTSPESSSTSASLAVHDDNTDNNNHNYPKKQHQRYLSKSNFINGNEINTNNLSANRNRQTRSGPTRLRLIRDVDGPSSVCCKRQCSYDEIKEYYCLKPNE